MWWASKKDLKHIDDKTAIAFDFVDDRIRALEKRIEALEEKNKNLESHVALITSPKHKQNVAELFRVVSDFSLPKTSKKPVAKKKKGTK